MNILEIEGCFYPDAGYQINILSKYLKRFGHQVTILTGELDKAPDSQAVFFGRDNIEERDRAFEEAYGVKIVRLPLKAYISGRPILQAPLVPVVRSCRPDVLFVHGCDGAIAMEALWKRKKLGCPLFMDCHMVAEASRNRLAPLFRWFYRTFMTPIIKKEHIYVVSLGETRYAERELGVPKELCPFISFGSDESLFHPDAEVRAAFRREHGIAEDAFVVFYAGKLDEAKNGRLLAELVCRKLETRREVVYVIVGNTVGEYGASVEKRFQESPYRVLRFPTQKYNALPPFCQMANLAVIPGATSLSLFDFNAAGLPVLAPDHPINVERCGHGNGWTFRTGDLRDFQEKLESVLALPDKALREVSDAAVAYIRRDYSYEKKSREYERLILETVSRRQGRK